MLPEELTHEWKSFSELRNACSWNVLNVMFLMGVIDEKVDTLYKNGLPYGSHFFYRLKEAAR